jgi:hypothetical protein
LTNELGIESYEESLAPCLLLGDGERALSVARPMLSQLGPLQGGDRMDVVEG